MSLRGVADVLRRLRHAAPVGLCLLSAWAAGAPAAQETPRPLSARGLPALKVDYVGPASGKALVRKCALVPAPGASRQLVWFKKDKAARESWFAAVNLSTGELREHGPFPGGDMATVVDVADLLYIGMTGPGQLLAYDPAADKIENLGLPFEKAQTVGRIVEGAPATVLLGAGMGSSEVALYSTKDRSFIRLGEMGGVGAGFVHALYQDEATVYAVTRGTGPWELVSQDLKSGERRVLLSSPAIGSLDIAGGVARLRDGEGAPTLYYALKDGHATPLPDSKPPPRATPAPRRALVGDWTPGVTLDDSPLFEGKPGVALRCQDPAAKSPPRVVELAAAMAGTTLSYLTPLPGGRLAALTDSGAPAVLFDPRTGEGRLAPMPFLMARCVAAHEGLVYATGAGNAPLVRWDPARPARVPTLSDKPAYSDPEANPRLLANLGNSPGGWFGGAMIFAAPGGRIYVCERRQRTALGFDFRWYDPRTGQKGSVDPDGAPDHLQATWAAVVADGRWLAIATAIEPDSALKSPVPESARIVLLDMASGRYGAGFTPLPDARALAGLVETEHGRVVGFAPDPAGRATWVYRFDLNAGRLEQRALVEGHVQSPATVAALPARGHDVQRGPDGMVWTAANLPTGTVLLRVDPADLTLTPLGTFKGNNSRFAFVDGTLYLAGEERLRRVTLPDIPPPRK
jgi:hypothetical protein